MIFHVSLIMPSIFDSAKNLDGSQVTDRLKLVHFRVIIKSIVEYAAKVAYTVFLIKLLLHYSAGKVFYIKQSKFCSFKLYSHYL